MATALYSPVETNILGFINSRLDSWRSVLQAHIDSFTELAELEKQSQNVYRKMKLALAAALSAGSAVPTPTGETASALPEAGHSWAGPWQVIAERSQGDADTYGRYLRETILPQLERLLQEDLKRRGKQIKGTLADAQAKLSKYHDALLAAMSHHERGWELRTRLMEGGGVIAKGEETRTLSEALASPDTFISELQLKHKICRFLGEKQSFCSLLLEQFELARVLEGDLAVALRTLLVESMKVRESQLMTTAELLGEAANTTRTTEPLHGWQRAIQAHRLDWEWQVGAPPVDGFTASVLTQIGVSLSSNAEGSFVRVVNILKSGYLMKPPSSITFGRSWSVLFAVLVDSAYLHCYAPESFVALCADSPASAVDQPPSAQRVARIPSPSMNLHRRGLAELNGEAARAWLTGGGVEALDTHSADSLLPLGTPTLSIPLLHPTTHVAPDPKNADKFVFSITVPGGSSLFGRSERRYVLRSFVEEDMVDWCIAIKEVIAMAKGQHGQSTGEGREAAVGEPRKAERARSDDHSRGATEEALSFAYDADGGDGDGDSDEDKDKVAAGSRSISSSTPIGEIENPWDE